MAQVNVIPGGGGPKSVRRLAPKDAGRCFGQDMARGEYTVEEAPADALTAAPEGGLFTDQPNLYVPPKEDRAGNLAKHYMLAPFSVYSARMGGFQDRKRLWISLGLRGEEGRQDIAGANNICSPEWSRGVASDFYEENPDRVDGHGLSESQSRLNNFSKNIAAEKGYGFAAEQNAGLDEKTQRSLGVYAAPNGSTVDRAGGGIAGTSIYDPVICDAMYWWFTPRGGRILDPFAGGSTRGCVAAVRGYQYTGIEIRPEQVEANERQAPEVLEKAKKFGITGMVEPQWIVGDSSDLQTHVALEDDYDLVFACPPYYDLEIYSTKDGDGSAYTTYEDFLRWYENIFRQAVAKLRDNRFAVITVGEIRDKKTGWYRNFVGDTITMMTKLGLHYYNEGILVTAVGSLPVRIGVQFQSYRKFGKTHQNVLVFWKGNDQKKIPEQLGLLEPESWRGVLDI